MKAFNVSHLATQRSAGKAQEMAARIKEVIYEYSGEMPLAMALGVLEVVKLEICAEAD